MGRNIYIAALCILMLPVIPAAAQDDGEDPGETSFDFSTDIGLSVVSFVDDETGETLTYQQIALKPDISIGNFGLGLNLAINYRFTAGDGSDFEVREEDWVPSDEINFLELYLPKIDYIRYGRKFDPLFLQFGSFSNAALGNGFIVENYSNELFRPDRRIFGGMVDVDGRLVGFPYLGVETMVANVAAWDVLAVRLYTRPLAALTMPILPGLQIGSTFAMDRDPYYHVRKNRSPDNPYEDISEPDDPVLIWGPDTRLPILSSDLISLAAFGDLVWQDTQTGGMVGVGGRMVGFLLYGAQIRLYEDNFIPTFFDGTYDRRRVERYAVYQGDVDVDGAFGWQSMLGFSFLADSLVFRTTVSGPFQSGTGARPELQSMFTLAEGVIPGFSGFSFDARYQKFNIGDWDDLVSAEDAIIGARFNIRTGPVIVSLVYDLVYDPLADGDPWIVSSGLETTISF